MHLVIFTLQISPYHNARYVGATKHFDKVSVISSMNEGHFAQFVTNEFGAYDVHRLYDDAIMYKDAILSGQLSKNTEALLTELEPDAIALAGWTAPEGLAALRFARRNEIPTVLMTESQFDDAPRSRVREKIKKSIVSQFDSALVGGPPHAEYVWRLGMPRNQIHFGYNAVDNEYFEKGARTARSESAALRRKHSLPDRYILASGRFIQKKNFLNLVCAYSDAISEIGNAPDLVIIGGGDGLDEVRSKIFSLNLESRIHLPGFCAYEDLPAFYALAQAFVHVAISEQWGLVINEAMASGVPVLASNRCGAARTLIEDGTNGLLTDPTKSSIENSLIRLFRINTNKLGDIARAGEETIREWGPEKFGLSMLEACKSASRSARKGRLSPLNSMIIKLLQRREIHAVD